MGAGLSVYCALAAHCCSTHDIKCRNLQLVFAEGPPEFPFHGNRCSRTFWRNSRRGALGRTYCRKRGLRAVDPAQYDQLLQSEARTQGSCNRGLT